MEKEEFDSYMRAGEIAKQVKSFIRNFVKPGIPLIEIARAIDEKIIELGGDWAFPVNLSINEIAAHYTPDSADDKIAQGLLKVDFGVSINGYIADTALSFDFSEGGRFREMLELNRAVLRDVESLIKPGIEIKKIGEIVQNRVEEWNEKNKTSFSVIRGLSGHSLGKNMIHAGLTIPNYRNENKKILNETAFAVEPFITPGDGDIYGGRGGGIYVLKRDGSVRDREARKLVSFVREKFKTRPFCKRWLEKEGFSRLKFILELLVKQGIFYEYPMLIEKSKSPVSQFENTFVCANGKAVCTSCEN